MKAQNYDWLLEGCHPVSEVAKAYSPSEYSSSATRAFRRSLKQFPKLYAELLEAEYTDSTPVMTPKQVAILVRHWGPPGQARIEMEKGKV